MRDGGRFGFLVPSGLYTDKGSTALRTLLLGKCRWEWLFGFENREGIFDIHRSFKFCPVIATKGGETRAIRAAFMHRTLEDWEEAERYVLGLSAEQVEQFSPRSKAILEIRSPRDLEVLEKLYSGSVLLGDKGPDGWGIRYATEFHMTNDSKLFPPRPKWEDKGYRPDEYSHWLKGGWRPYDGPRSILERPHGLILSRDGAAAIHIDDVEDVALPLYEGRMIGQFDFSEKGWVSGKGRTAEWREIPFDGKRIEPQYCMGLEVMRTATDRDESAKSRPGLKLGFMDVSSATNARTMISSMVFDVPCGNKVPVLAIGNASPLESVGLVGLLNSFAYDFGMRCRLGGLTLNFFIVAETSVPYLGAISSLRQFGEYALSVAAPTTMFAPLWLRAKGSNPKAGASAGQ